MAPLYVGTLAEKRKRKIVRELKGGKVSIGTYVLTMPASENNQLDIVPAFQLLQPFFKKHEPEIVGIALGKTDAIELVSRITLDAVEATGEPYIVDYLRKKQKSI